MLTSVTTMSRRAFMASLAAGVMSVGAGRATASRKYKYIDIHTHLGTFHWGRPLTAEGLLKLMDKHDIERAVVLPLVSPEAGPFPQTTEAALAAHQAHKDRLIPFCCVDPRCLTEAPKRTGHVAGYLGLKDLLKRYQDLGCRGLGEHKTGLPFDHPLNMTLYRACEDLYLPILFHLDDIRNPDTPGLPRLAAALKEFPRLPFIGHAAGFWASISGDATLEDFGRYPKIPTPISPGGALDKLMDKFPNLYGDLSEPGGHAAIARDKAFGREFIIRRADRLLFGTDFLMADQEIPHFTLFDSLGLPDAVQAKVFRGNALRLLKL